MNVTACLVTRGDVDMRPILDSLPAAWEIVIWDNTGKILYRPGGQEFVAPRRLGGVTAADLAVYGRYAAIGYASHDLIYVQDDDVIVSDPQAIVSVWNRSALFTEDITSPFPGVVCNMPPEFRPHYPDSGLVGFGAVFHRDAPARAFERFSNQPNWGGDHREWGLGTFHRRADNIFTVLTPRVLVDVPKTDLPYASDPSRMWKQLGHTAERDRMIKLARRVRDA